MKIDHDPFRLSDYLEYFRDVRAVHAMPKEGIVFTHYPIHPSTFGYAKVNGHGHTHQNFVLTENGNRDPRYLNLCLENTNFAPVSLNVILEYVRTF